MKVYRRIDAWARANANHLHVVALAQLGGTGAFAFTGLWGMAAMSTLLAYTYLVWAEDKRLSNRLLTLYRNDINLLDEERRKLQGQLLSSQLSNQLTAAKGLRHV